MRFLPLLSLLSMVAACSGDDVKDPTGADTDTDTTTSDTDTESDTGTRPVTDGHGPMAEGIYAPQGQVVPYATDEQKETFERGLEVGTHRFTLDEGLGPAFNLTFCLGCHEKPHFGGSAGLYRNFFLTAGRTPEGDPLDTFNAGQPVGGVIRMYYYGDKYNARPFVDPAVDTVAVRNPIPFFGTGLLAGLDEDVILANVDEFDADGDGISGRANYREGFLGRFGVKAQTESIEGFIRGPLMNHLGVTTNPLTDEERANLPIDSSGGGTTESTEVGLDWLRSSLSSFAQATAPNGPLTDWCVDPEDPTIVAGGACDDVPDPEMSGGDLFDLISFSMLLAVPEPEPLNEQRERGMANFDAAGCADCHIPRLQHELGPLPVYSDLLLHDMGPDLADGLTPGVATGSEFRTQPLWGISSTGPYLHDGRASTLDMAILWHGGEAKRARDAYANFPQEDKDDLLEFLLSLGGRDEFTPGLVQLDEPVPDVGEWAGPRREMDAAELQRFVDGRTLFDFEFGHEDGAGNPRMNGDSCRACHFEPVVGGAGPRGVNVTRHGILNSNGEYTPPAVGSILHRTTSLRDNANLPQAEANIFEHRQTPHLFGLGVIEDNISDDTLLAMADPDDSKTPDGITGRISWVDGGLIGRFGAKAQVPTIDEFIRDAVTIELGMTLPYVEGMTYGRIQDNDDVPDPEFSLDDAGILADFLRELAPPPRTPATDQALADLGEQVFEDVGCALCHVPEVDGVPLYSDLLLHEILPPDAVGIEEFSANMWEFRTTPLWGVSQTAPYMHSGLADTFVEAIELHDGEAVGVREAALSLPQNELDALVAFLETL